MIKRTKILIPVFFITILFAGCSQSAAPATQGEDRLTVSVSILPQKYFVERIGGERVSVNVMVGPGDSPHSYEPKASQMTALSNSDVYFSIGVEFENAWMDRICSANPQMRVVDLAQGISQIPSQEQHSHEVEESAEENGNHSEEMDPHIWTSPANGALIAEKIAENLIALDPAYATTYQENLDALLADISKLQADINTALADVDARNFMVFHPAWGYFAREFDLQQIPVEVAGSEPSASELAQLIKEAEEENISVIFAQPEFSTRSAEYIASEIDGKVILVSPLAEDWLDNMRTVAQTFAEEL